MVLVSCLQESPVSSAGGRASASPKGRAASGVQACETDAKGSSSC